jgi:hypothetical protein
MHGRAAGRAVGVVGLDRHIHARQMRGKGTTIDAALLAPRPCGRRVFLSSAASLLRWRQWLAECPPAPAATQQLLGIELLRPPAELRALQLAQEVPQAIRALRAEDEDRPRERVLSQLLTDHSDETVSTSAKVYRLRRHQNPYAGQDCDYIAALIR